MQTITLEERFNHFWGEIEVEYRDRNGVPLHSYREKNLIKIFAKEIFAHRLPYSKVWDRTANAGSGGWVSSGIDPDEELGLKYILFGASFDDDGVPLDKNDDRYYTFDSGSNLYTPRRLTAGAEFDGDLINPIPISEPSRPLKKIERIYFEPTYQPAGVPLLNDDVRAINNIMVVETVLRADEYNGLGTTSSDFFTITELVLAAGTALDSSIGACECTPKTLFRSGQSDGSAILASFTGSETIILDSSMSAYFDSINEGDQVKLTGLGTDDDVTLDQVSQYYLVISKSTGGSELTLDRTPVASDGSVLTGNVGVHRDGLKIFSHRILATPIRKSIDFEVAVRWRIIIG